MRAARFGVVGVLIGLFLAADLTRNANARTATLLSMGGWLVFLVVFLDWAWEGRTLAARAGALCRLVLLTGVSFAILYTYYRRSRTLDAGIHVDAVYTYVGLLWFTDLKNPITFAGATPSYHQFPMLLLSHLPALAVGFRWLGPFAVHFGLMVQTALLLAITTAVLVPTGAGAQIGVVALTSAVFSDRMLVLAYDKVGYAMPAICLGLAFALATTEAERCSRDGAIGGLTALAMLHYPTGVLFVLPIVLLWVVVSRRPLRRLTAFLSRNRVLLVVPVLLAITLGTHPELVLQRPMEVLVGRGDRASLVAALPARARYLLTVYPSAWVEMYVTRGRPSWHLLDVPPLGGLLLPFVAGGWLLGAWLLRGQRVRYCLALTVLVLVLVTLSFLQHLLTDMSDYRDFTLVFALLVTGLVFVFRIPTGSVHSRAIALGYALAFATFNYVDLGTLHGKLHLTADYAYRSQRAMQSLSTFLERADATTRGVQRIDVVTDPFFPLGELYRRELEQHGTQLRFVAADQFCPDTVAARARAADTGCEAMLFVENGNLCASTQGVRAYLYPSVCDNPAAPREPKVFEISPYVSTLFTPRAPEAE